MRTEVQRALKSESVRASLGSKITEVQTWLAQSALATAQQAGSPTIEAEETLLRSVGKYCDLRWEVKLAGLLAGI